MDQLAPIGPIYQAGTLSGNPLAMSAGIALLDALININPFNELEKASSDIMTHTKNLMNAKGIPFSTSSIGGMFGFFLVKACLIILKMLYKVMMICSKSSFMLL